MFSIAKAMLGKLAGWEEMLEVLVHDHDSKAERVFNQEFLCLNNVVDSYQVAGLLRHQ